jgi:hypothetical protein
VLQTKQNKTKQNKQEVESSRRKLGRCRHALERGFGTLVLSPSSLIPGYEVNRLPLPCPPAMMCCLIIGLKAMGPTEYGLKPLKLLAKMNFLLSSILLQ